MNVIHIPTYQWQLCDELMPYCSFRGEAYMYTAVIWNHLLQPTYTYTVLLIHVPDAIETYYANIYNLPVHIEGPLFI